MMNFFEQELRKILSQNAAFTDATYVGRACFVKLGDSNRARIEFVTCGTANHYEAVKATVLNKNDGSVDTLTLRFSDLLGKKAVGNPNFRDGIVPYIWRYEGKTDWYVYKPTKADYKQVAEALNDYIGIFREPAQDMGQTGHSESGPTMQGM